jgi:hypothetical protein
MSEHAQRLRRAAGALRHQAQSLEDAAGRIEHLERYILDMHKDLFPDRVPDRSGLVEAQRKINA